MLRRWKNPRAPMYLLNVFDEDVRKISGMVFIEE